LRWQHKWSKHVKAWQRLYDEGKEPPRAYYERPEIASHLAWLSEAFSELGTERQIGMAVGPIPRSKIKEYLIEELGMVGDEYDRAYKTLRKVDGEYLAIINDTSNIDKTKKNETVVESTDASGMRNLFDRLGEKQKSAKKKK
jgi:hypothetical protein